jgi:hypothetical protein
MNRTVRARLRRAAATSVLLGAVLIGALPSPVSGAACIATGAPDRDGTPPTARLVNPNGKVSGTIDATGCEVGVYYSHGSGRVDGAEVFGARLLRGARRRQPRRRLGRCLELELLRHRSARRSK